MKAPRCFDLFCFGLVEKSLNPNTEKRKRKEERRKEGKKERRKEKIEKREKKEKRKRGHEILYIIRIELY